MTLKLLSLSEVKQCISMPEAIDAMERAFIQLAQQKAALPLRTGIPVGHNGLTLTMPGYLSDEKILGLKVVSVFPDNIQHNKPSINGTILLIDASTGEPLVLMDAAYLTALRTGAVSGLASKYFSRDVPSTVSILGAGVQAMTQLEAVAAVRQIEQVFVWSRHLESAEKFAREMGAFYNIQACEQLSSALKNSDIICTATASTEPLVNIDDLKPHVHINAIGSHHPSMQEISGDVLQKAVVVVDQIDAVMKEAGEIINAVEQQKIKRESIIELGSWLLEKAAPVQERLTVFKSVGLAIQDLAVAEVVYQNALKMNLGTAFKLN
ncbi:ornithine cyclodeaminase [Legionella quinlivanii]|uniref:Ornithine cyclodeaminase n=1 Tax=Legionella quinlivanii TaxID=45073 RepID=A0A0W0Y4E4_9GAMM|nr:ornithine cyclodeaminase family protein [Legionella quinlivanii]KTD51863.1 ornithine cyclodeaminase [Legionella quinlivanii]MCW8452126.1 ornithine cyclodeaminase family protein [Legionella quinlivanii]SEF83210.1 ornithine cyclodeaminase [Legionella quinlivanii DSM 21216]STY09676.1 ornithine cyclodeaminase [Legionella quinlivanii]